MNFEEREGDEGNKTIVGAKLGSLWPHTRPLWESDAKVNQMSQWKMGFDQQATSYVVTRALHTSITFYNNFIY